LCNIQKNQQERRLTIKKSLKIFAILICLLLSISMLSCDLDSPGESGTPTSTPVESPNESTPTASTPGASSPAESSPAASTPSESAGKTEPSAPESSAPDNSDESTPENIYVYETLPDAFTELSADTRAAIEATVGTAVNWNKHYLGTHKGYIIFGTYDESDPKIYKKNDRYFGKLTELYGYKDGELRTFSALTEDTTIDLDLLVYISYLGLENEVGRLPVASEELSEATISKIKDQYSKFENNYFGTCGGYVIFAGGGNVADGYEGGIRKLQNHIILDYRSVKAYSPEGGFEDFFTLCNENLDIDYNDIVDTILIANLKGVKYWIPEKHRITE